MGGPEDRKSAGRRRAEAALWRAAQAGGAVALQNLAEARKRVVVAKASLSAGALSRFRGEWRGALALETPRESSALLKNASRLPSVRPVGGGAPERSAEDE